MARDSARQIRLHRFLPGRPPGEPRALHRAPGRLAILGFLGGALGALGCLVPALRYLIQPAGGATPTETSLPSAALVLGAVVLILALLLWLRRMVAAQQAELDDLCAAAATLRALLGSTSVGVVAADGQRRIRLVNPAAEILFGRVADEALSAPLHALIPGLHEAAAAGPGPGEDPAGTRVRHLRGVRGNGEDFPLRLLLRDLDLEGTPWLLILAEDPTESERAEAQLDYLADHDPLTGLTNRRAFEQLVGAAAADPARAGLPHALCVVELDQFKVIESGCGHAAGEKLLQQIAQIVSTRLAGAGAVARLGGDELAALFAGESAVRAESACEDLVRTVRSFLFTWQESSYDVTLSVGLVAFDPSEGVLGPLGRADVACQVAKSQGGDRLHIYSPGDAIGVRRHGETAVLSSIGRALDQGRFRILAQPILPLRSALAPRRFEILVRIQDDQGKAVSPDHVIPAAERTVLMPAVDRWVLAHLIRGQAERLRAWHGRHPDGFLFALGVSVATLMDDSFLPYVKRQFADNEVPQGSVCFQLADIAAVSDLARARDCIADLNALGYSFAVDEQGSCLASLAFLKSLPLRYLKIDGSFVRTLETDPVDRAFVESVNRIAHVLGAETVAESVETPELIDALRAMGVDYAEGPGVGEAVALDDLRV